MKNSTNRFHNRLLTGRIAVFFACFTLRIYAQLVTNNFETLSGMFNSPGSAVPGSSMLSNQLAGVSGCVFRSEGGAPFVAVVNLGSNHATSGTNGIGSVSSGGSLSYSAPIRITFVQPSAPSQPAIIDFVSIKNDLHPFGSGSVTLQAFGLDGTLLASASQVDDHVFTLSVTNPGIHSVLLSEVSGTVAYDDLTLIFPTAQSTNFPPVFLSIASALAISWPSDTNHVYEVEWASRLNTNTWFNLAGSIAGNGGTNTVYDTATGESRFYRIVYLR